MLQMLFVTNCLLMDSTRIKNNNCPFAALRFNVETFPANCHETKRKCHFLKNNFWHTKTAHHDKKFQESHTRGNRPFYGWKRRNVKCDTPNFYPAFPLVICNKCPNDDPVGPLSMGCPFQANVQKFLQRRTFCCALIHVKAFKCLQHLQFCRLQLCLAFLSILRNIVPTPTYKRFGWSAEGEGL